MLIRLLSALTGCFFLFNVAIAQAATCADTLNPTHYLVFSRGDMAYENSDFQGLTGAGRSISLKSFEIGYPGTKSTCTQLVAGDSINLKDAKVLGSIEAGGRISLIRASVRTKKSQTRATSNVNALGNFYLEQSAFYARQADNANFTVENGRLTFKANSYGITYISISADTWNQYSVVDFKGDYNSLLVINVRGYQGRIGHKDIQIAGIPVNRVLINFPEALTLDITASGSQEWGIPATVLAPTAATSFWNGRITGGLYAGSLCGDGQINASYFQGWTQAFGSAPGLRCPPSYGGGSHCPSQR